MPSPWGTFDLAGYHFARFLPSGDREPMVWTLVVTKDGQEVRRETLPLTHAPVFGPDIADVAECDERFEVIIKELGLE